MSPRRAAMALFIVAGIAWSPAPADAQPQHSWPFHMPDIYPSTTAGVELMIGTLDSFPDSLTLIALDFHGDYPVSDRLTLNGSLPIVHARVHAGGDDFDGTSLGNLTAGIDYLISARRSGGSKSLWSIGGSLSLATASDSGDSGSTALVHAFFRVPDPGKYQPNTTTLRMHGDYRLESGKLFFQSRFGLDVLVIENTDDIPLLRLGLGFGGVVSDRVALIAELHTMSGVLDDNDGEEYLHTLELGMRHHGRRSVFGFRFYVPLDDSLRDLDALGLAADVTFLY